jgi:hypothetical protein
MTKLIEKHWLSPCPFCGQSGHQLITVKQQACWLVSCLWCHTSGPTSHHCGDEDTKRDEARALWNARTNP